MGILPTKQTKRFIDPDRQIVTLYGPPKIGKSTTASRIKGGVFLATEAGLNALDTHRLDCTNWETLQKAVRELIAGKHTFTTVIVDTIDQAHKLCMAHMCDQMNIGHPTEARDPRQVWGRINYAFEKFVNDLCRTKLGVWMLSHSREEFLDNTQARTMVIRPTLTGRARDIVLGRSDIVMFAGVDDGGQRQLWCQRTSVIEAGDRSGILPATLPMSYREFASAMHEGAKPSKPSKKEKVDSEASKEQPLL